MENNEKYNTLHDYWLECNGYTHHEKLLFYLGATAVMRIIACDANTDEDAIENWDNILKELEDFRKENE